MTIIIQDHNASYFRQFVYATKKMIHVCMSVYFIGDVGIRMIKLDYEKVGTIFLIIVLTRLYICVFSAIKFLPYGIKGVVLSQFLFQIQGWIN